MTEPKADTREVERTFVFADLAGFTALTEAHGDLDAADVALRFAALAREVVGARARIVKTMGDEVMLVADAPAVGLEIAEALRAAVEARAPFPALRVGVHHGHAVECEGDYYGGAVNVAARVACVATAGRIVVTDAVVARAPAAAGRFVDLGAVRLRNVAMPVRVYELLHPAARDASSEPALRIDPICRMALDPAASCPTLARGGVTYAFCSRECLERFAASEGVPA